MQWFHRRSTKCGRGRGRGRGRRRRTNSARISHPPPFRRVTKNASNKYHMHIHTDSVLTTSVHKSH